MSRELAQSQDGRVLFTLYAGPTTDGHPQQDHRRVQVTVVGEVRTEFADLSVTELRNLFREVLDGLEVKGA